MGTGLSFESDPIYAETTFWVEAKNSMSTGAVFQQADLLIAADDAGAYYVPGFSVDQIVDVNVFEGYAVFLNGANEQSIVGTRMSKEKL